MTILARIFSPFVRLAQSIGKLFTRFAMPKLYRAGSLGNPVRGDTKPAQPNPDAEPDPEHLVRMSQADDPENYVNLKPKDDNAHVRAAGFIC